MASGVDDEPAGNDVPVGEPAWSESFLNGHDVANPASNDVSWDGSSSGDDDGGALNGSLLSAHAARRVESDGPFVDESPKGDPMPNGSPSVGPAGAGSDGSSPGWPGRIEPLEQSPPLGAQAGDCAVVELDALVGAIDTALDINFEGVPAGMLADLTPLMAAIANRVQALDARFIEALDASGVWARRGHRNVTAMLASGNAHPADSAGRARRASRLCKMRLVEQAFVAGDITADHVRLLGELTQRRWLAAFTEAEAYLVDSATSLSWREFAHVVEVWKSVADPTEPELKADSDAAAREFHLSRSFNERGIANGAFTPEARVILTTELDRITKQLLTHDCEEAKTRLGREQVTGSDLLRTPQQRRHDAIVIMAKRSSAATADADGGEAVLQVRVSQECMEAAMAYSAGITPEPIAPKNFESEFDDGTPLTHSQLMRYLIKSKIHSVVLDQQGAVLHYGRGRRFFDHYQKAAIAYRDRFCLCGCGMLAKHCDIDHTIEWTDHGQTDLDNGQPRCRTSHTHKTEHNKQQRKRLTGRDPNPDHH